MNILFMNSAREWGGTEKWTRMAAESLAANNRTILVYRRKAVGRHFTIPSYRLPCWSHIDLYTILKLVRLIRKEQINILVPTKRKDYLLAGIAGKITRTPVILRLGADRPLRWPWQRFMYHTLTSGIIVNAEKIKRTLLQTGYIPEQKIKVIYNGLDTTEIDRQIEPPIDKPFPFTIAALGRITKNKGFDFLIRSFARFQQLNPDAEAGLVVMGEGSDRPAFEALSKELGLSQKVRFSGFLQNPYPTLQASDIFAMTSTNEGLSNALLEAMYLRCAPISTYAGGVEEVITNAMNGLLINYGDEKSLAEAITRLYRNETERKEMAEAARERVEQQFSIPAMAESIAAFCRKTAGRT
ncbi:glycosyltransferase [Chlorobium phaeovibrioides]|uniref:Glycosyltransferase n=1 Tax=Chlorobium phaeovibrioides TaxID=1094 RepID=A0A5M8IBF8_CHLPH|nr:glycosyltransferase [Chlorobium phaeovibrioides]KAA6232320.1 glycosyltransferase [Chlorobium phaeovibrioides]